MPFSNRSNNEELIFAIRPVDVSNCRNGLLPCGCATSRFARISPAKNSPSRKKTCSNTAPTAPTLSIPYTYVARNSRSTILSPSPWRPYREAQIIISQTFLCFFSLNYCKGEKKVLPLYQKKQRPAFLQGIGRLRAAFFIYHGT